MADIRRLPGPVAEVWAWQLHAACRGEDTETFFHPEGERGPARVAREAAAKAVCARCPVMHLCAAHALSAREPYGVWGGLSEYERETILSRRAQHEAVGAPAAKHPGKRAEPRVRVAGGAHTPATNQSQPVAG